MSLGLFLMSLGVGLEQDLGNEFGVDFDEFDEFGSTCVVYLLRLEVCLMSLGARSMTLGVGLEQELGDEFGGDFRELDEFGGAFAVCFCFLHASARVRLCIGLG